MNTKIVDADAHVTEPPDLWERYIDPEYRHLAMQLTKDDQGLEYLSVNGQKPVGLLLQGGTLGRICSIDQDLVPLLTPGMVTYEEGIVAGAVDPHERIKVLDGDGIDVAVLYPSLGLSWQAECRQADVAEAYCRAYNDWLFDFCKPYPERLISVAMISMIEVEGAVTELARAGGLGAKGMMLSANSVNGRPYGDVYFDPFWAEAQGQGVPIGLHVVGDPSFPGSHLYPIPESPAYPPTPWWFTNVLAPGNVMIAFTTLFEGGVFDRFPNLKVAVLESGCGWIAWWLERMDHTSEQFHFTTPMKLMPSEYFQNQCWISMDPDEDLALLMIERLQADRFVWASDYPHSEGHSDPVNTIKQTLSPLPEPDQAKVLGENAIRLYNL